MHPVEKVQKLVDNLHLHGFSQMSVVLQLWLSNATEEQCKCLCESVESWRFETRYTFRKPNLSTDGVL